MGGWIDSAAPLVSNEENDAKLIAAENQGAWNSLLTKKKGD
jgi:hypothetical protein